VNDARLVDGCANPAVRLERLLPDSPETVWLAITEREQLRSWFPCDVIVETGRWDVGAPIKFVFPPEVIEVELDGRVLVSDPPRKLAYTWGDEILSFELTPHDGGTLLVLIDELPPGIAARNAAGWELCLDRMSEADRPPEARPLDARPPEARPLDARPPEAWKVLFDSYSAAFEPTLGPQEGPPAGYGGDDLGWGIRKSV
jgi:uncharacterized protein YndB with AHSA1/START domain